MSVIKRRSELGSKKELSRVAKFEEDLASLKSQLDRLKSREQAQVRYRALGCQRWTVSLTTSLANQKANSSRNELFASSSAGPHLRRRYSDTASNAAASDNPYANQEQRMQESRHDYNHRENSFLGETDSKLDEFIEQGRAVLNNLVDQRQVLKGTQSKILSVTSTLGLSKNLVQQINRRSTQDKWILFAGATFTLVSFYYIVRWLG